MFARPAFPALFVLLAALDFAFAPPAPGQEVPPPVPLGSRVRVSQERPGDPVGGSWRPLRVERGRLEAWSAETLTLDLGDGTREIPLARVSGLEVSRGKKGHALTGALVGAGVGALVSVAVMFATADESDYSAGAIFLVGCVVFVLPGTGIGAGIGALARTDRWEPVPLPGRSGPVAPAAVVRVPVGPRASPRGPDSPR